MYSEKVMEHFGNPRNIGEIENADGIGEVGNPVCGDMMSFYIKVEDDKISDIKFKTFGCVAAIAVSRQVLKMERWLILRRTWRAVLPMNCVLLRSRVSRFRKF